MTTCPQCTGQQPGGVSVELLAWQHRATCPLLPAEDATRHADHSRLGTRALPPGAQWEQRGFSRPSTATERELLAVLGHDAQPDTRTFVRAITDGRAVVRRTWPDLETNPGASTSPLHSI